MVDAVSTNSAGARINAGSQLLSTNFETFLSLLTAQLKNQDPLSPMNGDEMAAQLAQFSSLEQLTEIRDAIGAQTNAQASMLAMANGTAAINLLGRTVVTDIPHFAVEDGAAEPITVEVPGMGGDGTLRLYDADGREVKVVELGQLGGGRRSIDLSKAIEGLPDGAYTFAVEVVSGRPVHIVNLPGPNWWPFIAAVCTGIFFLSFLLKLYPLAAVGVVLTIASFLGWAYQYGLREDAPLLSAGGGYSLLPHFAAPSSPGWWGMLFAIVADGTLYAALLFGYLFLWTVAPAWPPPVYVGFGSMAWNDPQQAARNVVEALNIVAPK